MVGRLPSGVSRSACMQQLLTEAKCVTLSSNMHARPPRLVHRIWPRLLTAKVDSFHADTEQSRLIVSLLHHFPKAVHDFRIHMSGSMEVVLGSFYVTFR